MKKAVCVALAIALLVAVVCVSVVINYQLQNGTAHAVTVETTNYPLKMTMTLNKTSFKLGESVNITYTIENIGNETWTLSFSDGCDQYGFVVRDLNNTVVYTGGLMNMGYAQVRLPIEWPPGIIYMSTWTWWQWVFNNKILPGTYRIACIFDSHSLNVTVETPPVTITIWNQTRNTD